MEQFYATDNVAEILSVPKKAVQRWIREGRLAAIKLGRVPGPRIRFRTVFNRTASCSQNKGVIYGWCTIHADQLSGSAPFFSGYRKLANLTVPRYVS